MYITAAKQKPPFSQEEWLKHYEGQSKVTAGSITGILRTGLSPDDKRKVENAAQEIIQAVQDAIDYAGYSSKQSKKLCVNAQGDYLGCLEEQIGNNF